MKTLIAVVALLAFGCATPTFTQTGEAQYPPHTGVVAVMREFPPAYKEIGIVSVNGPAQSVSSASLINAAQRKAAAKGANAIVLIERDATSSGGGFVNSIYGYAGHSTMREITAMAIRLD